MSNYTIQRGERTFRAKKLETLRELIRRGYLGPDDVVSVDGGPFYPLRALDGLDDDARSDDPWKDWDDAREDDADEEAGAVGTVLSDFLSGLEDERPRQSATGGQPEPTTAPQPPAPGLGILDRAEPPSLAELADIPSDLEVLTGGSLQALDLEEQGPGEESPAVSARATVTGPPPSPKSALGGLRLVEPEPAPVDAAPLSFGNWMDTKGAGPDGRLLENFGRVDDGIVLSARRDRGTNWYRIAGVVAVAAVAIAFGHTWVRTVAQTPYPTEAELVANQRGDGPAVPGEVADRIGRSVPKTALDMERRLRSQVAGEVPHFGTSEELEDVMFAELMNLGIRPMSVEIDPIRLQGSGDYDRDRPVEANIWIRLNSVQEREGEVVEVIHERLALVWFVTAKYSVHGKVTFRDVKTSFGLPNPYQVVREGRELTPLWSGRGTVMELLNPK